MHYILNYCSDCCASGNFLTSIITGNLTGTEYQRRDIDKHLAGNNRSPLNGIFAVSGTGELLESLRSAAQSGVCAVESGGTVIGFYRSSSIADRLEVFGHLTGFTHTRKLVLLTGNREHGYPFAGGSTPFGSRCDGCGEAICDADGVI